MGAETRFNSREGAREASRAYNRCSRVSETCTHKPISLAYLGSSNRAHTVVLRGSSRARCERGLGWGEYRGSWAEPAWFSTACDPNRCMLKPTASLCAVHQNGILLASRLALRRADGAKLLGDSVDFGLRRRRGMHGGLTRHSRGEKIAQCRPPWVAAARSFRPSAGPRWRVAPAAKCYLISGFAPPTLHQPPPDPAFTWLEHRVRGL